MTIRLQKLPKNVDVYLPVMVSWLNDPEVVRYSEQRHKHHTAQSQLDYLRTEPTAFCMIYYNDKFIGTGSAYIDKPNSVADVGILIGSKKLWGKGLGLQAWKLMCESLFKDGIRKIEAGCMGTNLPMIRICQRYGMLNEGRRINHFLVDGQGIDMLMWGKSK